MKSCLLVFIVLAGCTDYLQPYPSLTLSALPIDVPAPLNNPTRQETVELGRLLFWDPVLSGDRSVACATCHHPDFAYADGMTISVGVGGRGVGPTRAENLNGARTPRNSPTVLGAAFNGLTVDGSVTPEMAPMFWDERTLSLELQALGPIISKIEMRGSGYSESEILDEVVRRLASIPEYQTKFQLAFGSEGISASTLARAIAAFERTLIPRDSSFDRYLAGDNTAMTTAQIRGMRGFIYAGCAGCHAGPLLSDFRMHKLPVPTRPGEAIDLGNGKGQFRTPSLRMVTLTGPYMHNGSLATLDDVLDFYHNIEVTDPLLQNDVEPPLGGADDLLLFFSALSDGTYDRTIPPTVPSGLVPGGL